MIARSVEELIGNTPLIRLEYLESNGCRLYAKAEYLNPGSSVKDRIAKAMIDAAYARGEIDKETVVIEPTSGNTGIGLAMICALRGLRLILTMPESMSIERRKLLRHLGAELVLTPAAQGMRGAIAESRRLAERFEKVFLPSQFDNPDNPDAHYRGTGPEILQDLPEVDLFVAAVGTGGSFTGTTRYLKERLPDLQAVAVEPKRSAFLSRGEAGPHAIQGIGAGFAPSILDRTLIDTILTIDDEEAYAFAREAARKAALLVGISSGANLAALRRLSLMEEHRGKTMVTILPDTAERYLSTALFE
ncbi:cysteine synthase A [Nitratifractor sp.]